MKNITHYTIVTDFGFDKVEQAVRKLINSGWQPYGGVSTSMVTVDEVVKVSFAQALVKYEN